MSVWRKRQIQMMNDSEEATDYFEVWWSTLSVSEQKLLGYNNAKFVWQEALSFSPVSTTARQGLGCNNA